MKWSFAVALTHGASAVLLTAAFVLAVAGGREVLAFVWLGGRTVVTISNRRGRERGEALCHPTDTYNRKLGLQIALGRALKQLGRPELFS